jgi:aspartate kinase
MPSLVVHRHTCHGTPEGALSATFFAAMAEAGLNIEMISTSEIRISIICRESDLEKGVRAAHTAFGLDADQVEAVVYGGTGR